jgi:hypothetical protein
VSSVGNESTFLGFICFPEWAQIFVLNIAIGPILVMEMLCDFLERGTECLCVRLSSHSKLSGWFFMNHLDRVSHENLPIVSAQ